MGKQYSSSSRRPMSKVTARRFEKWWIDDLAPFPYGPDGKDFWPINVGAFDTDEERRVADVYTEEDAALIQALPDLLNALLATRKELKHWLAWADGRAMNPQREKGEDAVRIADIALEKAAREDI